MPIYYLVFRYTIFRILFLFQDSCENFFTSLRGLGGSNTHPDVVQAMQRVKIRLLCSENGDCIVPVQRPTVEPENLDEYVPMALSRGQKLETKKFVTDEFEEEEAVQRAAEDFVPGFTKPPTALNNCEEEGLCYIAGYLCYKKGIHI